MPHTPDDETTLIAALSEGDTLARLKFITLDATWQDLKTEVQKRFRPTLRAMGVGHSFFRGRLWLIPLNGGAAGACVDRVQPFLQSDQPKSEDVELDASDAYQWNGVIKRVVRDAIAYGLRTKENIGGGLLARGSTMLGISERQKSSHGDVFVAPGLDLHRVYRATNDRILVACSVVFRVLDAENQRVSDRTIVSALSTKAYAHSADNRWAWMERISQRILPLAANVGDRKMILRRVGIPVGIEGMVKT